MDRRIWVPLATVILFLFILLVMAPSANAGMELRTESGSTTFKVSVLPYDVKVELILSGSTIDQADYVYVIDGDPETTQPLTLISGSSIKKHYNTPGAVGPMVLWLKYSNEGDFTAKATAYNTTYENGTIRAERKVIQEATLSLTIKLEEDGGSNFNLDIAKYLPLIIGAVVLVVIILAVKLVMDRGGLGLYLPTMPGRAGGLPPATGLGGGSLSSLGGAHEAGTEGAKSAAKGPKAKRDCPGCGTAIPITTDQRPLRLTCPNSNCGKSFTLKGKSGAVAGPAPRRRPRPGAGRRPVARKGQASVKAGRKPVRRPGKLPRTPAGRPRRVGGQGTPKPKAKPPAPKAKPPAPKAKPLHCPDDGAKLDHYPNAAKKYGYDSDYFCPTCELYVTPREHQQHQEEERPAVAGPFGGGGADKPKPATKPDAPPADREETGHPGGQIICPNCSTKHEVPQGSTKSIMCSCGRRLRVKQG